ncbi:MAG: hypothetical protein JWM59_4078 [Verrucomicrobiales bacterium]|nr:hypothetical protein [Verrucomicrobiales bacterium]
MAPPFRLDGRAPMARSRRTVSRFSVPAASIRLSSLRWETGVPSVRCWLSSERRIRRAFSRLSLSISLSSGLFNLKNTADFSSGTYLMLLGWPLCGTGASLLQDWLQRQPRLVNVSPAELPAAHRLHHPVQAPEAHRLPGSALQSRAASRGPFRGTETASDLKTSSSGISFMGSSENWEKIAR